MEVLIVTILLAILAVIIILLVWVKVSTGNSIKEVIVKLNSLNIKVDEINKKYNPKPILEEEKVTINENLLSLME